MSRYPFSFILILAVSFLSCQAPPSASGEGLELSAVRADSATTRAVPETELIKGILIWQDENPYLLNCMDGTTFLVQDTSGMLSRSLPVKGVTVGETVFAVLRGIFSETTLSDNPYAEGKIILSGLENATPGIPKETCKICADFKGIGDEPGWSVNIYAPDSIILQTEYGMITERFPYTFPTIKGGEWNFEILSESGEEVLYIRFIDNECLDNMLGASSPYQVFVDKGFQQYKGCGTKLN
ncbi:MAG: hypothetical protein AAF824_16260 [Bacteroidota bacterium]